MVLRLPHGSSPRFCRANRPESVRTMKKLLGFAILGLTLSLPIHAQRAMGGSGGPASSAGGASGSGIGGGGTVSFHTLPDVPRAQFQIVDVSGGDASFFPSSFMQFEKGIAEGEAALAFRRKSLGEVARENRAAEKPKAHLTITQDSFGNAYIERQ
jgi:hypothetical protein